MAAQKNERLTENVVRDWLKKKDYYNPSATVQVDEQKTNIAHIKSLLKTASKTGKKKVGSPEFIITDSLHPDFAILIECKYSSNDHSSDNPISDIYQIDTEEYFKRVQKYASDGVLHYARALSRRYNVIAVAVSGKDEFEAQVSCYLHTKGTSSATKLTNKNGSKLKSILAFSELVELATFDPSIQKLRQSELMEFSRELHDFMRDHAKLTESEKPLLVSGTLIALRNKPFANSYELYKPAALQKEWLKVIKSEISEAQIPQAKKDNMAQPYSSISVHPELGKPTKDYPEGVLRELVRRLHEKVWPFISVYHDFDIVGQFYGEFLKYTGGDKKALGIVLTPRHITELFAHIANIQKDDTVVDICAGTGGFLISAMNYMVRQCDTASEVADIKQKQLIGVEQQPNMFALAASNMILRGDGKANLYQGSCFDNAIAAAINNHKPTVGLLNPPFSQSDEDLHELYFVKKMLDMLERGGIGVAIVPMSCAIAPHPARHGLLAAHRLEAVMSMPDELFYPVGTVTCVMVFRAHQPHATAKKKTWFGYWKNDGFVKTKHRGRIDLNGTWQEIKGRWVEEFRNNEVAAGRSVLEHVDADNEWCAEAYMQTDYSCIHEEEYREVLKRYFVHQLLFSEGEVE